MRIVKTQWIRLAVNVLVSWLPFSGQAATVGLLVEPINQVSSLSGNSCSWQLTHTRGYAEPSVNWANDRSYIEGMQRAEQFGQVATYFSEQWDTQVYFTRTAIPNSAGEVSLIDPDSKAVFIFVHGSGTKKSSGRNYIHNMNTLANLGFSALAFDMPFHADGPVDPKLNYSNHFMEWVRQIVLEAKKAGKPVYLAGHSFGPEVALEFVAQFPKLVDGVVALSPAGFTKELDDWYENYTTKMNFGGEVPENEKGGEWAAKMSEQFIWNKSKTADPTLVNPRLRIRILSGDREEYVPAPVGGPNNTPIGPNTYDIRPPLKQMLRNAVVTIEPGIGHYLFDFVDSEGNNVVTRELLLVAGEDPAQAKNLIDKRRKENMSILNLNQDSFDAAINSNTEPVLVDFWAEWCGPCKMIAPVLKEIATEQAGKAVIAKVNIDESPELAVRFGITGIPTLIVFKNGKATTTLRGVQSNSVMVKALTAAA